MIFISHASEDRLVANQVVDYLERAGGTCWIAPRDVRPGRDFGTEILDAIDEAKSIVLLISKNANSSKFVPKEIERAIDKNKMIYPVRIDGERPDGGLEFFVSNLQSIDASTPPIEAHLAELATALELKLPPPGPLPPARPKTLLRVLVALAALAILAGAGYGISVSLQPSCTLSVRFDVIDDDQFDRERMTLKIGRNMKLLEVGQARRMKIPAEDVEDWTMEVSASGTKLDSLEGQGCPGEDEQEFKAKSGSWVVVFQSI